MFFIPRSFRVINVCNQGKNLCSPCILKCQIILQTPLHVSVLLRHLQGALILLFYSYKILKLHRIVDLCVIKHVLLI